MTVLESTGAPGAIGPYSQGQGFEVNGLVYTSSQIPVDGEVPVGIAAQVQ